MQAKKGSTDPVPDGSTASSRSSQGARKHLDQVEKLAEKRIGELLVDAGVVRPEDLERAQRIQAEQGGDIVRLLISLGCIGVDEFMAFLAEQPGIHRMDLSQCEIDPELVRRVPRKLAEEHEVFPIDREGNVLTLGIVRPIAEEVAAELEAHTGMRLKPVLCSPEDIRAAVARYYAPPEALPTLGEQEWQGLAAPLRLSLAARLIREVHSFPALPETVARVRQAMSNPKSSIRDVAEIIIMDPPIAAKVLSVANSAAYGFPRQVEDVTLAVTLLGLREAYSIVLSVAVLNILEKSRHIDYKRFWLEALCCAAATRFVLKAAGRKQLPGVFVGGLLHDIGRVALAEVLPELSRKIDMHLTGEELIRTEERLIGLSHAEAGYILAGHWGLPPEITQPIRFHHRPQAAEEAGEVVAVVAIADDLARASGATLDENRGILARQADCLKMLGIDMEAAEAMLDDFLTRRDESLRDAMQ